MALNNMQKLYCPNCKTYLGQYNIDKKLYIPHIPINRKLGDKFFVLPVIFINKDNPTEKFTFSDDDFLENQEIFGNDDLQKTKRLAKFQYGYLNNKGLMINTNRTNEIECGNYFTDCPECNAHYNFEILRLEGKDDPLITWA